jgi:hypothetical protein
VTKKTFREQRRYGEGPSGYVVRFYWDLAQPQDVQPYWIDFFDRKPRKATRSRRA